MMFMNQWDIQDACDQFAGDPVFGPATLTLHSLMSWTNHNSDGWAYWPKPCRAAKSLQEFIQAEQRRQRTSYWEDPDEREVQAQYKKALSAIKAFRTRQNADFEILEVA